MKISSVPAAITPTIDTQGQQTSVEAYRSMKMNTHATPLPNQMTPQQAPTISEGSETKAAVEATQPLSPQLSLLAKQRRALQIKERELKERERALQANPTQGSMIDVARLKSEPLNVLLENGVTYDQLTEAIIAGQKNSEVHALKAEIESLKQGIDQKFTERETQQEKQVLAEMQREAQMLAQNEQFELVRETRSIPTVMKLIERTYRESGEVLDVSEALRLVEDELFKDAQRIAQLKKMQSQQMPVPQMSQQRQTVMRTLTNRDTAQVPMSAKQRALAAFYGNLKR